jgi:hypothetical protein
MCQAWIGGHALFHTYSKTMGQSFLVAALWMTKAKAQRD